MRLLLAGVLALTPSLFSAQAVQSVSPDQSHIASPSRDGGVREVLESIVIPPIPQQPFTAVLNTEWVRYAGEGATITSGNQRRIARDRAGRVYQERWYLVPKNGKVKSEMNWIQIADPKQRTLYNCSTVRRICELKVYDPGEELAAAGPRPPLSSGEVQQGNRKLEDLGAQNIAGVETVGRRETRVIPPGEMGNDQAITSTEETWHSQALGINLLSIRSGPIVGRQTFTIVELTAGDPDPDLFKLPAGYEVRDVRQNAPISH